MNDDLEGSGSSLIKVLHRKLPGVPEENFEKSQPGKPMSRLRFKFSASQTEVMSDAQTDSVKNNPDGNNMMMIIYGSHFTPISH
jgi:hypothetical protein